MKKSFLSATATLAIASMSTSASAATLFFDFVGIDAMDNASFSIDSNPVPDSFTADFQFTIADVAIMTDTGTVLDSLFFYNAISGGGFATQTGTINATGLQLFSGTVDEPTFLTGVYSLDDFGSGDPFGTLTISTLNAAIPEPATWAFMIFGFGAIGGAMRSRRRQSLTVSYS